MGFVNQSLPFDAMIAFLSSQWTIHVKPKFHEDADKLELLFPFEEHVQLESSTSWVKAPEYLLLTNNGRSFKY